MAKKAKVIPTNFMATEFGEGISIERLAITTQRRSEKAIVNTVEGVDLAHRHDSHSFFLLESGTVHVEIDFQKYVMKARSVIYIHPDQVHRTTNFKNVRVSSWALTNEKLHPEYIKLLEDITPAKPLLLTKETFSLLSEAVSLCLKFSKRKKEKLFHSLLKDSCNALVALVVSQYLEQTKPTDNLSRFEIVNKAFKTLLEKNYITIKRPTEYARQLNISTPYLNECVKNTTGYSVSYHIQQRVVLEAKRLLYHSNQSVKEIAFTLGYDDYPYFSRLFTKLTGTSALSFRNKNHE